MALRAEYHEQYIPSLKRTILFCNHCGEYGTIKKDDNKEYFDCSNPWCPEHTPDCMCKECEKEYGDE